MTATLENPVIKLDNSANFYLKRAIEAKKKMKKRQKAKVEPKELKLVQKILSAFDEV